MKFLKFSLAALLLFSASHSNAQTLQARLENSFKQLEQDSQTKYGIPSLIVLDGVTGEVIFAKNENIGLAPASTLKTIVASTAYYILGKDYTYNTFLKYNGVINADGVLNGDLILEGSGDPSLGSWRYSNTKEQIVLQKFVAALQARGIKQVNGRVIGNNGTYPSQTTPEKWIWQDMGNYYGAAAAGLNWRENQFDIELSPGPRTGAAVKMLKTVPNMSYLNITNELITGASGTGDNAYAYFAPYYKEGYLRGTWGMGIAKKSISASLPDPAFEAAFRLVDTLKKLSINVSGGPTTNLELEKNGINWKGTEQLLTTHTSPSLSELSYWYLNKSINLYGEAFIKSIAQKAGKEANTKNGTTEIINFWKNKGYDGNSLRILDGSGLAPETRVTTKSMANILFDTQKMPWFADFLKGFPVNNGMKIKSGNIAAVQGYAGYHTAKDGKKYVVVININNYNGSGIAQKLFRALEPIK